MAAVEGLSAIDAANLFIPTADYRVLAVAQSQMTLSTDELVDAVEITWQVPEYAGTFTYTTPASFFQAFAPTLALQALANQIRAIYAL